MDHTEKLSRMKRGLARYMRIRNLVWLVLPILIWWLLRTVPFRESVQILAGLKPSQIAVMLVLNVGITLLFSLRWWLILRAQGQKLPYLRLASYRLAGFGVSYFTPGPQFGGEPLQVYLLASRSGVSTGTAIAAVTLDKLLELLANFSFLAFGVIVTLASGLLTGPGLGAVIPAALGLLLLPLGYLAALFFGARPLSGLLNMLRRRAAFLRLSKAVYSAEEQMVVFCRQKPALVLAALAFSWAVWGLTIWEYAIAAQYLGLPLNGVQVIAALTAARAAFLLPMPGGLGTLEASQMLVMSVLGFNPAYGASLALLTRLRDAVFAGAGLGLGAIFTRQPTGSSLSAQAGD